MVYAKKLDDQKSEACKVVKNIFPVYLSDVKVNHILQESANFLLGTPPSCRFECKTKLFTI